MRGRLGAVLAICVLGAALLGFTSSCDLGPAKNPEGTRIINMTVGTASTIGRIRDSGAVEKPHFCATM